MRILLVSSYLPHPLHSGGQVRLFNLVKQLSREHRITLVCEVRPGQTDDDVAAVERHCEKVITVPRRKQWSVANIARSGTSARSFLLNGHRHAEMRAAISAELDSGGYSLIHVETFYVLQNVPPTTVPIVLVEHNIEYMVYDRFRERAPLLLRPLLTLDVAKIRREEEASWRRADALVAVSDADRSVMRAAGVGARVVANGVDTEWFGLKDVAEAAATRERHILFIGDFRWLQNRDSATFILEEVWPLLRAKLIGDAVKLRIVGRQIPDSIRRLASEGVLLDEASSARPTPEIFREASVLLAPIRVGGGTSYKILEAMSCGTPVVTMELSAGALQAGDGDELLVGANAAELADHTVRLLEDPRLYQRIAARGRAFVEERYTWNEIARSLAEVYSSVAADSSRATPGS